VAANETIEELYIELGLKTDKLRKEMATTVSELEKMMKEGVGRPAQETEQKVSSLGKVMTATFQNVITTLANTKNPITALASGIQTFNAGAQSAAQHGEDWATSLVGITGKLAGLITVLAVVGREFQKVINFLQQTGQQGVQLAATIDTVTTGLKVVAENAGKSFSFVQEKVQQLQASGITTRESIESIVQFLTQEIPVDNIEALARAGQDMSVAFGKNSTETFNRFVYAITTGNAEVLRTVGITTTASRMMETYAQSIGKTAEQLTDVERRQALVNGILKEAENYTGLYEESMNSLGKRIGSLARIIEEGTLAFGQTLLPLLEASVTVTEKFWKEFQKLFVEMETVTDASGKLKEVPLQLSDGSYVLTDFGEKIKGVATTITDTLVPAVVSVVENLDKVDNVIINIQNSLKPIIALLGLLNNFTIWGQFDRFGETIGKLPVAIDAVTGEATTLMDVLGQVGKIGVASAKLMAAAWSLVGDVLINLDRLVKGEVMMSFDEMILRAQEAANAIAGVNVETETPLSTVGSDYYERHRDEIRGVQPEQPPLWEERVLPVAQQMGMQLASAIEAGDEALRRANQNYTDALDRLDESVEDAERNLEKSRDRAKARADQNYFEALTRAHADYLERLEDVEEEGNEAREELQEDYQDSVVRATEDFHRRMLMMEEDYQFALEGAVQNRDARQVLSLMRQHERNKARAQEEFDFSRQRADEDQAKRLQELEEREQEVRDDLKEAYEKRRYDLESALMKQKFEINQSYQEQLADLRENTERQRDRMKEAYMRQREDLIEANDERLEDLVQAWADQGIVNEEGAQRILQNLDDIYGRNGAIASLIDEFTERVRRNRIVRITIETNVVQGNIAPDQGDDSGSTPSRTTPRRPQHSPGRPGGGRALGGFDIIDQPTSILAGEAGREAHLFVPMTAGNWSLSQLMNMLGSGTGAGGVQRIAVDITAKGEGSFDEDFEDKVSAVVADIVVQALPSAEIRRG